MFPKNQVNDLTIDKLNEIAVTKQYQIRWSRTNNEKRNPL